MDTKRSFSRSSTRLGRSLLVIAMLIFVCTFCSGCLRPPTTNDSKSNGSNSSESASHPNEYYEGYWLCSGYKSSTETISFSSISSEERKSFPYFILEMGDNGGVLYQINNGDGEYRMLFGGESCPTSDGIKLINEEGSLDFVLAGENLLLSSEAAKTLEASANKLGLYPDFNLPHSEATYYFERLVFGSQLSVSTFVFDGVSLDVPIDIAYALDGMTPDVGDNGGVFINGTSYRRHGPEMDFISWPTDADNIAEVVAEQEGQDYTIEHADEFVVYDDVLYHLLINEELNNSRLGFVANGKLYEIDFNYDDEDVVDYSDYREHFFTSIRFVGEESETAQSDMLPSGAIAWQEAPYHVGEMITVYGPVADIEYASSSDGQPTFIDLGVAYPDSSRVTMVVWGEDRDAFPVPPEEMYLGKTLCVTGEVYMHEGVCNIRATSPAQVQILSD